jgi:hypothetical protein
VRVGVAEAGQAATLAVAPAAHSAGQPQAMGAPAPEGGAPTLEDGSEALAHSATASRH